MKKKPVRNLAASVREHLRQLSRRRNEPFDLVLTKYALERLLYRLGRSDFKDRFVLKGAMLFALWTNQPHRPTRDADLLGFGPNDVTGLVEVFRDLCSVACEDGLQYPAGSVRGEAHAEDKAYQGVRITMTAMLERARIPVQVDIGFGDVVTPAPEKITYPALLDFPAAELRAYPMYTVVAEKFEAAVKLGEQNGRMKDFYDLWAMARQFEFEGGTLSSAIRNTFDRRKTTLPAVPPVALPEKFVADAAKQRQWSSFLSKSGVVAPTLPEIARRIETFLSSPTLAAARREGFRAKWTPPGPWRDSKSE
ncbi:MAG TPA: nucleotidyl transferase AbiEii/AbiGii toxin family protein [Burkholderiales bacterium]|nr:nucleotidyl transferase AbiEii/AbiGii toxin family protein [Burkholderiales bacterium]